MQLIKIAKLVHDYIKYNEDGDEDGVNRAIDGVDLEIERGSFTAILGHNGSGKSTLAKHLNAILLPTEGTVWVGEKDTSDNARLWDIRQGAGMVFQNPDNQIIGNVVEEDVAFGPENIGVPTPDIWTRVEQSLEAVGMMAYRKKSPNKLSGGQKQRVAIAGVMAMKPECIILDEPTAMLDPNGRQEVIKTIRELNRQEGITVVLITHYMEEVIKADRVVVMDEGKIVMDGTPREIFSQVEQLKSYRLDVPQVTELAYELQQAGLPLPSGILTTEEFVQALCTLKDQLSEKLKMNICTANTTCQEQAAVSQNQQTGSSAQNIYITDAQLETPAQEVSITDAQSKTSAQMDTANMCKPERSIQGKEAE